MNQIILSWHVKNGGKSIFYLLFLETLGHELVKTAAKI
jgi:hypothetical protein